jgi:hypothetical protein
LVPPTARRIRILFSFASHNFRRAALVALAGAVILPGTGAFHPAASSPAVPARPAAASSPANAGAATPTGAIPSSDCLATTVCRLKDKVRWRTAAWTPAFCGKIADAILSAADRYQVEPMLILAVMLNESDLDEKAANVTLRDGRVYAKDTGLMGIRCVLDGGRCKNGNVRGMAWKSVADPVTNIHLGARELSLWRKGGGVVRKTVRVRGADGALVTRQKFVHCKHQTHAYWAHYNHGPLYIASGPARHYPHRVGVLYHALARAMDLATPELARTPRLTIHDPGERARTADRPVEPRFRKLCEQIREVGGVCARVASAASPGSPHLN